MITVGNIVKILNATGYEIGCITDESFKNEIKKIASDMYLNKAIDGIVNDLKDDLLNYESSIEIESKKTLKILSSMNFEWPSISRSYIMRLLNCMTNVNFIDRPKEIVNVQNK